MAVKAGTALAAALAAAAMLVLTGCGPQQPFTPTVQTAKGLTAAGSARQVLALFRATQAVVGADGWYEQQNWFPSCGSQDLGLAFSMYMERDVPVTDAQAKQYAVQVQQVWKRRGVDAQVVRDPNINPPSWVLSAPQYLTGTYPDGSLYKFYAGKDRIQFAVQGKCGTGPRPKYGSPDWPSFPSPPPAPPAAPGAPEPTGQATP